MRVASAATFSGQSGIEDDTPTRRAAASSAMMCTGPQPPLDEARDILARTDRAAMLTRRVSHKADRPDGACHGRRRHL
jgi:hypothetical protein